MKIRLPTVLSLCSLSLLAGVIPGSAQTLDFEDWTGSAYAGFSWSNFSVLNGTSHSGSGYRNSVVSPKHVAFNGGGYPAEISRATAFDLSSAYLTAAWNSGLNVDVLGFRGATQIFSRSLVIDPYAPTLFTFNFTEVDRVRFESWGGVDVDPADAGSGTHFAMDDITFGAPRPCRSRYRWRCSGPGCSGSVWLGGKGAARASPSVHQRVNRRTARTAREMRGLDGAGRAAAEMRHNLWSFFFLAFLPV